MGRERTNSKGETVGTEQLRWEGKCGNVESPFVILGVTSFGDSWSEGQGKFVQLALQWAGDAQRAIPKAQLAPPLRPVSLLRRMRPLHPLPQGSPHYRLAFTNHVHLGAPHVTLAPFALSRLVRILQSAPPAPSGCTSPAPL